MDSANATRNSPLMTFRKVIWKSWGKDWNSCITCDWFNLTTFIIFEFTAMIRVWGSTIVAAQSVGSEYNRESPPKLGSLMGIFSKSWNCLQELRDMICCAYRWNAMIFGRFNFEYFIYGAFLKGSLVNIMNESWTINTVTHNPYTTYRNKRRQSKMHNNAKEHAQNMSAS